MVAWRPATAAAIPTVPLIMYLDVIRDLEHQLAVAMPVLYAVARVQRAGSVQLLGLLDERLEVIDEHNGSAEEMSEKRGAREAQLGGVGRCVDRVGSPSGSSGCTHATVSRWVSCVRWV